MYQKFITEKAWLFLVFSGVLFLVAFIIPLNNIHRVLLFIFSGVLSGLFYGEHNHEVWPMWTESKLKNGTVKLKPQIHNPERYEKMHNCWVHIVGGVAGGTAGYLLFAKSHVYLQDPLMLFCCLDWVDLVLFLIVILGYSGYIPRTLWFMANKGGPSR